MFSAHVCAGATEAGLQRIDAKHALWVFDISTCTWQHMPSTGDMPVPALCLAMAVIGHRAYVLVNHHDVNGLQDWPDTTRRMEVYMLDLNTWHWSKLPSQDAAPMCVRMTMPCVVQVSND